MNKQTTIKVPDAYLPLVEDIRLLQSDQHNPNVTTLRQQEEIWKSLQTYGWAYPLITNKDGTYLDGEQRAKVCLDHAEFFAPVLRLPVSDVDRRMLRQILNKLKGKHNRELDAAEYMRIVEQGEKDHLKALLAAVGERLPQELIEQEPSITIPQPMKSLLNAETKNIKKKPSRNSSRRGISYGF